MNQPETTAPHRVIIADDHPLFRMGLRYGLEAAQIEGDGGFEVVGEAENGLEALYVCRTYLPDIALLDVKMPELTGIEVCEAIRKEGLPILPVLITTFSEPAIIQAARQAGAKGYLSKETEPQAMAAQLRQILEDPNEDRLPQVDLPHLTPRELDILPLLARGLSNKAIARELGLSPDTVKDHLARMYGKLDASERTGAVGRAQALGLLDYPS